MQTLFKLCCTISKNKLYLDKGVYMADDLKIDRIVARCTVSYKKDLKKIVKKVQTDVSGFTIAAINEKIKRDGLEDVK